MMTMCRITKTAEQKEALSKQRERLLQRSASIAVDRNVALSSRVGAGAHLGSLQVDETDSQIARQIAELELSMQQLGIEQVEVGSIAERLQHAAAQSPEMPDLMHLNPLHQRYLLQRQQR